jgi:hypothetical protein
MINAITRNIESSALYNNNVEQAGYIMISGIIIIMVIITYDKIKGN